MNDRKGGFLEQNKVLIDRLYDEIINILRTLDAGEIVENAVKIKLVGLLDSYLEVLREDAERKKSIIKRSIDNAAEFHEAEVLKELKGHKDSIDILMRIAREKIIRVTDKAFDAPAGKYLLEKGYLEKIEFGENAVVRYFALSEKGVQSIKSKPVNMMLKREKQTFIVPTVRLTVSKNWSNLYCRRLERIESYYRTEKNGMDFFAFYAEENVDFLFACDVAPAVDVNYVFSGIFEQETMDAEIERLRAYISSGLVDEIRIIVASEEEKQDLLKNELLAKDNEKLLIYVMKQGYANEKIQ